jgi:selenocysteine lyase/cysteine desulfurase
VFAITRTIPPLDAVRISVGFFNTADELERFAEAVELLASHTPATIPQKQRLTIVGQDA